MRGLLKQLNVLFDTAKNKFYLIINDKEMIDDDGKFERINTLSNKILNLGSIHNNEKLVRLFNV